MMRVWFTILIFLSLGTLRAQDFQFTQFYAAPLYVNPGYAGSTHDSRAMFNYRWQWFKLDKAFVSYTAGVDHSIPKHKSGVGFLLTHDKAGTGKLRSTSASLQYAYRIDFRNGWHVRPGLDFSVVNRNVNFYDLTFGDQINKDGNSSTLENFETDGSIYYFDISSGVVAHNENMWFGYAAHHINGPNQSLQGSVSRLPTKHTFHGGMKIHLVDQMHRVDYGHQPEKSVTPAFIFRSQGRFDQLDLGLYWTNEPVVLGAWYRGIPVFKSNKHGYFNQDAIAILIGYKHQYFNIGYSYDITISNLNVLNTAGTHELSMSFTFFTSHAYKKKQKVTKRQMVSPCPDF